MKTYTPEDQKQKKIHHSHPVKSESKEQPVTAPLPQKRGYSKTTKGRF